MNIVHLIAATSLLLLEATAIFGPEFKTSSPGFHKRRFRRLGQTDGYRLPGTARPIKYDLNLFVSVLDQGPLMEAEVEITLDVDDTDGNFTYSLELNSEINFDTVDDNTFRWNDKFNCFLNITSYEFLKIDCEQPINGTNQKLKIRYIPKFASDDMNGAYLVRYSEKGVDKYMVATQFEEGYARRIMPCFDEPEYKAPIQLTLRTKTSTNDLSDWIANTKVIATTKNSVNVSTTFASTPNMSTYLLAFVLTEDFKNVTDDKLKADYQFAIFVRPSAEKYVSIALQNGPKLINLMGTFTGIPYPNLGNPKMTLAAIPEFAAGAMENWGLITFREQILVDEGPTRTTARDRQFTIEVIAHELTHQWFGDYVTLDWWSEAWLNEGFAQYFEYFLTDQISSDFQMMRQLVIKQQQVALKTDAYPDTIPLSNNPKDVTTENDFSKEFGDISYSKGASIVKLIRYAIGTQAFQKGIQAYLEKNKHGNTTSEILINSFQAAAKDQSINLPIVLKSWIYQPGYPILDVSLSHKTKVTVRASKFSSSLNKTGENNEANWWIPLTYTTSEKPDFKTINFDWIDPVKAKDFSVTIQPKSWIIINLQSAAYFRVNYDATLWERIINVLNNSKTFSTIDVLNRAQLLDDAFNVARSYEGNQGLLRQYYLKAFKLAEYLQYETEYMPWYTFFVEMQYLIERVQDKETLEGLKSKILQIITPQVKIPSATDSVSHTEILKRNLLLSWACRLGHEECKEWTQKQFKNYQNDQNSIDNNYRDVIICGNLQYTNQPEADFTWLYSLLKNTDFPNEAKDIAKSFSCLRDEALLNKTLQTTVNFADAPYSRMFFDTILTNVVAGGADKVLTALKFLMVYDYSIQQYWKSIEDRTTILRKISAKIFTQSGIDLLKRYIREHETDWDRTDMIDAAKESLLLVDENLQWLNKYGDVLTSVILYDGGDPPLPTTTQVPETTTRKGRAAAINCNLLLIAGTLGIIKTIL